jgi:hypothetical protein
VMLRRPSQISFVAASSVGKWPRVLRINAEPGVDALQGVRRVEHTADGGREGEERDDVGPGPSPGRDHGLEAPAPRPLREDLGAAAAASAVGAV